MSPWLVLMVAASTVVGLSGCNRSAVEKSCQAKVAGTLINPETAEFYDFRPLTGADFDGSVATAFSEQYQSAGAQAASITGSTLNSIRGAAAAVDADLYLVRARAEGTLGNRITSDYICMAESTDAKNCQCFPVE